MKILLAEDDPHVALITQLCLEKIGHHTVTVRDNGESALETGLREPFDLILLDGMMPKKSGIQVAEGIKSAGLVSTPIIFLSAKNEEKDINEFLRLGVGYISKPFDPQKICWMIEEILKPESKKSG
jgi:DNA-binding response OmpR family regulator